MRGKALGFVLMALGIGVVLALILPPWMLLLLLGLGLIVLGFLIIK
jgi:hypothetical protein